MFDLTNKSFNSIYNLIDSIFLFSYYGVKNNSLTNIDYTNLYKTQYDNFANTSILNYYSNHVNKYINISDLTTVEIGRLYGNGIYHSPFDTGIEISLTIKTDNVLAVNDILTFTFKTKSYPLRIWKILSHVDDKYIIHFFNTTGQTPPRHFVEQFVSSDIDIEFVGMNYFHEVEFDVEPISDIEFYNEQPLYTYSQVGTTYKFVTETKYNYTEDVLFETVDHEFHKFTYQLTESDKEILTLVGYENTKFLDLYLPYINYDNEDWIDSVIQIQKRYEFLDGYYQGLKDKLNQTLFQIDDLEPLEYTQKDDNLLTDINYTKFNSNHENVNYDEWYNVLIDLFNKIDLKQQNYNKLTKIINSKIQLAFNMFQYNKPLDFISNNPNSINEIFEDDIITIPSVNITDNDNFILLIQYINSNNNIFDNIKIINEQYNNDITYSIQDNITEVFTYYNNQYNINYFTELLNNINYNNIIGVESFNIINNIKNTLNQIMEIKPSKFNTYLEYANFIKTNITTSNSLIESFITNIYFIEEYDSTKTYNKYDNITINNKVYYSMVDSNLNRSTSDSNYWTFLFKDDFTILNDLFYNNSNKYKSIKLKNKYFDIIDKMILGNKIHKDYITEFEEYNLITNFMGNNWYIGNPVINESIFNLINENINSKNLQNNINNIMLLSYDYLIGLNNIIEVVEFDKDNKTLTENYKDFIESQTDWLNLMFYMVDNNENSNVDEIFVVRKEEINDFISKLNELEV